MGDNYAVGKKRMKTQIEHLKEQIKQVMETARTEDRDHVVLELQQAVYCLEKALREMES